MVIDWVWVLIGAAVMLISVKKTDVSSTQWEGADRSIQHHEGHASSSSSQVPLSS